MLFFDEGAPTDLSCHRKAKTSVKEEMTSKSNPGIQREESTESRIRAQGPDEETPSLTRRPPGIQVREQLGQWKMSSYSIDRESGATHLQHRVETSKDLTYSDEESPQVEETEHNRLVEGLSDQRRDTNGARRQQGSEETSGDCEIKDLIKLMLLQEERRASDRRAEEERRQHREESWHQDFQSLLRHTVEQQTAAQERARLDAEEDRAVREREAEKRRKERELEKKRQGHHTCHE